MAKSGFPYARLWAQAIWYRRGRYQRTFGWRFTASKHAYHSLLLGSSLTDNPKFTPHYTLILLRSIQDDSRLLSDPRSRLVRYSERIVQENSSRLNLPWRKTLAQCLPAYKKLDEFYEIIHSVSQVIILPPPGHAYQRFIVGYSWGSMAKVLALLENSR